MTAASAFSGMRNVAPVMFRAGCPDCRERFELSASALRLAIGASSRTTFYSFTCPECGAAVRKPGGGADRRAADRRRGAYAPAPLDRLGSTHVLADVRRGLGFLGLAVLAVLAVRVFVEAERLGRQVADSARRIGRAAEDLERAAASTARSAEAL